MGEGGLDLYRTAYIIGGSERVALVALVALHEEGRIRISPGRHRVSVLVRHAEDPIAAAAVDAIPDVGKVLGAVLRDIAGSAAVGDLVEALKEEGIAARRRFPGGSHLSRRGRRLRRTLTAEARNEQRVAVQGTAGIVHAQLRRIFETPDPPAGSSLLPSQKKRTYEHDGPYETRDKWLDVDGSHFPNGDHSGY